MKRFVSAIAMLVLGLTGGVSASAADRVWNNHAAPYDFLFGNHIDSHLELRLWKRDRPRIGVEKGDLTGWFYVTPMDNNGDGVQDTLDDGTPVFRHCMNEADYAAGCVAGWKVHAKPCIGEANDCRAMNLYHFHDHPEWLLDAHVDDSGALRGSREHIVQGVFDGSFTHFHWLTESGSVAEVEQVLGVDIAIPPECDVAMAGALTSGVECPGYFLQIRALRPMGNAKWAFHHGGENLVVRPGTDNKTHLNIVTSYRSVKTLPGAAEAPKNAFNILMNYELGMHCTGFEFAYCCVLPPYNSILAQVVKTEKTQGTPMLLEADPNVGLDFLGRPTVVRDTELDENGNFRKYVLKYWHEAQPRNDGRGAPQLDPSISLVEGNSLLMWNTRFDAATTDTAGGNKLVTGDIDGATNVLVGDGDFDDDNDNYANAWLNHFYIYADLEGSNPTGDSLEKDKIRLGMPNTDASTVFSTIVPDNLGPAFHPVGPGTGLNNILTFSGETGTVVYTQMKVLENLPVMLTSPRIWEALGLPLTPFEDTIDFFSDPGAITEETVRPYVKMNAQLYEYDPAAPDGAGTPVLDDGTPVIGFGTAPIDIPNCERCHALGDGASVNSANNGYPDIAMMVQDELEFWNAYYDIGANDSDWYSRLKAASISILGIHDRQHGTSFTANFPATGIDAMGNLTGDTSDIPQNTRLGHQTVLCQRCHADNVIAVVKSATHLEDGELIPPLTEAIHDNHKDADFSDSLGRNGSCQGCHPAHRSDGDLAGYPITELGLNAFAGSDNRDAAGGCYVGRDVHSNPGRNTDGAETPEHLNVVGQWLVDNVANDTGADKGIWCTNCHTQLSQEIWKAEDCPDLIRGDCIVDPRGASSLAELAAAVGVTEAQAISWLDPKTNEDTFATWEPDMVDANVATIEVDSGGNPVVTFDGDGDPSVNILSFCTTDDCVADINDGDGEWAHKVNDFINAANTGVPVPFSAADDARDHWLSPGVPHCADCHAAPYVEQSGHVNFFPPFNYPRKAAMFRYTRGHRDITCQGCHESIHGLYPVTPDIDTTTYAQAASLNADGSHGPLKCGSCHKANSQGVIAWARMLRYNGQRIATDFDAAVGWAHTFTEEADPTQDVCRNCHMDRSAQVSETNDDWLEHADEDRVTRAIMDQVEISLLGHVAGDPAVENPLDTVCQGCHEDRRDEVSCDEEHWKEHIPEGRVAVKVWEYVSTTLAGSTCGW